MANDILNLAILGGAGVVGYKYWKGEWPWQAPWWPIGPGPAPPELSATDVNVPSSVNVGEKFTVSATVENEGESEATGPLVFTSDGEEIDRESVSLSPGATDTVSIGVTIDKAGTYTICVEFPHKVRQSASGGACISAEVE